MSAVVFALALAAAPPTPKVRDNPHFDAAVAAWKDERWDEAAAAFTRAYALDPRPEYVFARAQALRFSGACTEAIVVYREFIALEPPEGAIEEARQHIEACGGDATAEPPVEQTTTAAEPATTKPSPPVPTPAPVHPEAPPRAPAKWWRDPAGHVLGWTGLLAAAVGTGFVVEGLARRERGDDALDEQSYRDARRGGASLLHAGIPLVSVGGALVLGSVIRFAVVARARRRHDRDTAGPRGRARASSRRGSGISSFRGGAVVPIGLGIAWSP